MKGRIGPYRISERIGTGGMGEVFKAFDDRLDRWVAIKRIRPGKEDTDENRERFLREARATAQLNHSSIVHVYDIFRDDEGDCIVMEYVEGRSLQSLAAEGPLDPVQAAALGQEIAEGLGAAHAKGILHRDLKTENVIITPEGHAKILDFGLAKPLVSEELDPAITGKGQLVGTSRSMSPEYVGGDRVDHRSDLFALGVLLYEVITGHSPFKAQNTLATLKQVIVHRQPPANDVNPNVPQELSDLVDRLLEKSPDDRPQSAKEVATELGRLCGHIASDAFTRGLSSGTLNIDEEGEWSISTTVVDPRLRRYWIVLATVVVAALVGAYLLGRRGPPEVAPPATVSAVLGFENLTNESVLDNSLELAFRTGLERSRNVKIMPKTRVREVLERMQRNPDLAVDRDLGLEICQREGIQALVVGSIGKIGSAYALSAKIINPQNEETVYSTETARVSNENDILGEVESLTRDIRARLGEVDIPQDTVPLEQVTTSNLRALQAYSLGVAKLDEAISTEALPFFVRAVVLDPEFAMAHAKLGTTYMNLGEYRDAAEHLNKATIYSDRLPDFEKLYLQGMIARLQGTQKEMLDAWWTISELYPDQSTGYHNAGIVLAIYEKRFDEAAEAFRKAIEIEDFERRTSSYLMLAKCHLARGRFDEAAQVLEECPEQSSPETKLGYVDAFVFDRRYDEAQAVIDELVSSPARADAQNRIVLLQADRGQLEEALTLARGYAEQTDNLYLKASFQAVAVFLLGKLGRSDEVPAIVEKTLALIPAQSLMENRENDIWYVPTIAHMGKACLRSRNEAMGQRIANLIGPIAQASRFTLWQVYASMLDSEILLARGKAEEARAEIKRALGQIDFFTGHETLARINEQSGAVAEARREYEWLVENRGRAFSECLQNSCVDPTVTVIEWAIALGRLADLYATNGEPKLAEDLYERLLAQWLDGGVDGGVGNPLRQEAADKLNRLRSGAP